MPIHATQNKSPRPLEPAVGMRVQGHDANGDEVAGELVEIRDATGIVRDKESGLLIACPWPYLAAELEPPSRLGVELDLLLCERPCPEIELTAKESAYQIGFYIDQVWTCVDGDDVFALVRKAKRLGDAAGRRGKQ